MDDSSLPRSPAAGAESAGISREELHSALFAQMVIQQSHMAMLLLGRVPHPESGKTVCDLEGARLLIDQLEALEAKTRGNLNPHEEGLLKQNLMALHLAFVEAVEAPPAAAQTSPPAAAGTGTPVSGTQAVPAESPPAAGEQESHKRFSKKY